METSIYSIYLNVWDFGSAFSSTNWFGFSKKFDTTWRKDVGWLLERAREREGNGMLNADAASLLDDGFQRHTVVLVGVTGDGKSSTGNTLCGTSAFQVSAGFKSETQELAHADYLCGASFWRVIDTIGLQDTNLTQKEVLDRFSTFSEAAAEGIDCFLFVVRWGRFKPEHDEALAAFALNCGESALRHTMLVFTHCDLDEETLQRQVLDPSAPPSLRHWLERIGGGFVGIDNTDGPAARLHVQSALTRLVAGYEGGRYSNEALADAREKLKAAEEAESKAFAAAVAEWRRGSGPVSIEREEGVITRPPMNVER